MKQTQIITLEQAKKRMQFFGQVEAYKPITLVKKLTGFILIGYGVGTLWCPISASVVAIMGGCALLAIDYKRLLKTINFYGKETAYWILRVWRSR